MAALHTNEEPQPWESTIFDNLPNSIPVGNRILLLQIMGPQA